MVQVASWDTACSPYSFAGGRCAPNAWTSCVRSYSHSACRSGCYCSATALSNAAWLHSRPATQGEQASYVYVAKRSAMDTAGLRRVSPIMPGDCCTLLRGVSGQDKRHALRFENDDAAIYEAIDPQRAASCGICIPALVSKGESHRDNDAAVALLIDDTGLHPEDGPTRSGAVPVVEPTAAAVLALRDGQTPAATLEKADGLAEGLQHPDGGWGMSAEDGESGWHTAWAMLALRRAGGAAEPLHRRGRVAAGGSRFSEPG